MFAVAERKNSVEMFLICFSMYNITCSGLHFFKISLDIIYVTYDLLKI